MIHRGYSKYLRYLLLWNDVLLLNSVNILAHYYVNNNLSSFNTSAWLKYLIIYNLLWVFITFLNPTFNIISDRRLSPKPIFRTTLINIIFHGALIFAYTLYFQFSILDSFIPVYLIFTFLSIGSRQVFLLGLKWYRKKGFNYRNIILIETKPSGNLFNDFLETRSEFGYRLKKVIDINFLLKLKSNTDEFKSLIKEHEVDEVFINPTDIPITDLKDIVNFLEDRFIKVSIISNLGLQLGRKMKSNHYGEFWFLNISPIPMDKLRNRLLKRVFDILFSLVVIVLILSWLYPIISILILIQDGSPVLFKQLRTGEKNSEFNCIKFRTMKLNIYSDLKQATKDDPRITKLGDFLRKSSIDELPQFFNVLIGEMSVVGPRPHMLKHTEAYSKIVDRYFQRHHVKPGITGLAQTKGYRGEILTEQDIKGRIDFDKFYIENWSFAIDIKIILNTFVQVLKPIEKNNNFDRY